MPRHNQTIKEINILSTKVKAKPFLKWAGGKRSLLHELKKIMPEEYNTYYEPFVGGGALFFSELPPLAVLSDKNKELINCYKQVKNNPDKLINVLKPMKYNEDKYYEIRSANPKEAIERAARFIYLNRCCWNGLWRVNSRGKFNVPFGKYANPTIYDENVIMAASEALRNSILSQGGFLENLKNVQSGDFVYFDPPYTVKHGNNGFLAYNEKIFSWDDQIKLASLATKLSEDGAYVMISNADHEDIKELYRHFHIKVVKRTSTISGEGKGRGEVTELIITSYKYKMARGNLQ